MARRKFTIDGREVRSFDDFIAAANTGFIEEVGGRWGGQLDAFDDYLSWPGLDEYELELLGADSCARALGHTAYATWLRDRAAQAHPSHAADLRARLAQAEASRGPTLFDVILGIIAENPHVRLALR